MRILFVVPGMGYGGAERVISILANSFINKKHDIKIIMVNSKEESVYQLNDKVEIQTLPSLNKKMPLTVIRLLKMLRKEISLYKPSAIISFIKPTCAITAIANLGLGYPIIFSERCDPSNTPKDIIYKTFNIIVDSCAKGFVFQSEGARLLYSERVRSRSTLIFNPLNLNNLPISYNGERRKEIVSIGRLHSQKNHKMLIQAFANITDEFPDYKLLIYGEGELRKILQNQIDDLGLTDKVFLMGTKPNVLKEINGAAIYAFTSDYEGLPNSLIEAMALGLPCLSTDFSPGGAATLIQNNISGIIVPVGDEKKFTEGLKHLLTHPQEAAKMGHEAKKIIELTEESFIVDEWEKYIMSIIQESY